LFGEKAEGQIDNIAKALEDTEPLVITTTLSTLASMGVKANGAIPVLEQKEKEYAKKREERKKDPDYQKFILNAKPEEIKMAEASLQEEQLRKAIEETIGWIKKSKPGKPGGDPPPAPEPKKP